MLVLSRQAGERVVIGPNITVTVIEVSGGRVKLGFDAPAEVSVHREEVHRRVQLEKQQPCERLQPKQSPYFSECA